MIYISFYISKWTGKAIQWGLPFSVAIEPTTSCNLRCPECPSGLRSFTRPRGMLNPAFFKKFILTNKSYLTYLTFYFQGEPYLNKDFLEMVKLAVDAKIYTSTSTNAHYLNDEMAKKTVESGLDRIIISLDGTEQETYQSYRIGGQLSKVLQGTENLVKWKEKLKSHTPHIIFQFLVVKPNEHQISEVYQLADKYKVDEVILKTAQIYDYKNGHELIPNNEEYSRYLRQDNGTYKIKNQLKNQCWKLWHSCVITWDGDVVPCCFDKDANHKMGSLKDTSMPEIWRNKSYYAFRKQITTARSNIEICTNCSEGSQVNFSLND